MAKKAEETMSKSEAVRQTIAAGIDNPTEGSKHIKEKLGLQVTAQMFSTIKSQAKRKKGKKRGRMSAVPTAVPGPKKPVNGHVVNAVDLARGVKSLVETFGAEAVRDMAGVFSG